MNSISIPVGDPVCPSLSISTNILAQQMEPMLEELAKQHPEANFPASQGALTQWLNHEINQVQDKGRDPWHTISRGEAGLFILHTLGSQRKRPLTLLEASVSTLLNHYFYSDETEWIYDAKAPERRYPTEITHVADGDTDHGEVSEQNSCPALSESLRFAGIDTPESFVSEKLERVKREVALNLGLPDAFLSPLELRIRYLGDLAKIVNRDFTDWVQQQPGKGFQVGWNYIFNTTGDNKDYLGLLEPYDKYFRRVATIYVSDPNLIARYFREQLPILMKTEGVSLYRSVISRYPSALEAARAGQTLSPEQLAALDPKNIVNPALIFSPERSAALAAAWRGDDWTMALIQSGVAYHYRKYDNQHGPADEAAQDWAKQNGAGFWSDPIFFYMDPAKSPSRPQEEPAPEVPVA